MSKCQKLIDFSNGEVCFLGYSWFSRRVKADCGHEARSRGMIIAYGQKKTFHLLWHVKSVKFCLECEARMITRCAWCGRTIFLGSPITMYSPKDRNYQAPKGSRAYAFDEEKQELIEVDPLTTHKNFSYVGCLGWNCADGMDRFGFWVEPGRPERFMSPLEAIIQTGQPVIVGDLGNMAEAAKLEYETQKQVLIADTEE